MQLVHSCELSIDIILYGVNVYMYYSITDSHIFYLK